MSADRLEQNERSYAWVIKLMVWIAVTFGRRWSRLCVYPISLYYSVFSTDRKAASKKFLGRALSRKINTRDVFWHYYYFGSVFLDRVFILRDGGKDMVINVHGESVLSELKGQGCLLFGSHLGSFEIARAFGLAHLGFDLKVMMDARLAENTNAIINGLNPEFAKTIIPIGDPYSLLQVKELVSQGQMVALLADRTFRKDKHTVCSFLGENAPLPTGPITLAAILKVPVILFFGLYDGADQYDIYFEKFTDQVQLDRQDKEKSIQEWTQRYADRLAHYCKLAPFNWFNFYDFWKETGPGKEE